MTDQAIQYDVALSFAGEQRPLAGDLAQRLVSAGYAVFFDEYERAQIWGGDLAGKLQQVYEDDSRLCVILISEDYVRKPWPNLEREFALWRDMHEPGYIVPIQVDSTQLPGLPRTRAYLDLKSFSIPEIFDLLQERLGPRSPAVIELEEPEDPEEPEELVSLMQVYPRNFLVLVVTEARPRSVAINMDCHLVNQHSENATLRRLEAQLRRDGEPSLQLVWRLFYDYLPSDASPIQVTVQTDEAGPLPLEPETSRFLGIQFLGPEMEPEALWKPGIYELEMRGWAAAGRSETEGALRTRFQFQVDPYIVSQIESWSHAPSAQWDQLNDPDRAIGFPVQVLEHTIAAA